MLGALLGMGLGLALAAIVTSVFADGLAFAVPVASLAIFTIVAIAAGVLAAILPARRPSRIAVLDALATSRRRDGGSGPPGRPAGSAVRWC